MGSKRPDQLYIHIYLIFENRKTVFQNEYAILVWDSIILKIINEIEIF